MFRRSIIIFLLVCIITSFSGCGVDDYEYVMSNGFRIVRVNSERIVLCAEKCIYEFIAESGKKGLTSCAVENYIHEFSFDERYIAVKWFEPSTIDFENFNMNNFSNPTYYFVDTISTTVYGPYETQEKFEHACKEMNVGELGKWISTRSNPNEQKTNK